MAFQCGFFNSVNGDRKYNAEQMNNPYHRIVSNGVFAKPDGYESDDFQVVSVSDMQIKVKTGDGIFADKWAKLDADMLFTIPTPHVSYSRIDSIIIRIDTSESVRAGEIIYRNGEPAENPVKPELERNQYVTEYRLANISVAPNATEITQANIEDTRPTSECGWITHLINQPDFESVYIQWQAQFTEWFDKVKETLVSATAIISFSSNYTTEENAETIIPIQIERFNFALDILQVYINGLKLIPEVDYIISSDHENIILTRAVSPETQISFVVYKSVDGSEAESVVTEINELYDRMSGVESRITALEKPVSVALWSGADQMGENKIITPTKKLSDCKTGWCLVWSQYSNGAAGNADFVTSFIPRAILQVPGTVIDFIPMLFAVPNFFDTLGSAFTALKRLDVSSTQLKGFAGNTKTTDKSDSANVCLRAVYEY